MKLKSLVLASAMACTSAAAAAPQSDWAQLDRYAAANDSVAALPQQERRVVLMGNSITDFWPGMRPDFFAGSGFVGRGISGQTTYQFLVRFREDVVSLSPQIVVINGGTNDVAENTHTYSEERTFGNIVSMVQLARAAGITPVLGSVLPASHFYWNPQVNDVPAKIRALNARMAAYAEAEGLAYVDYHSALTDADGALRSEYSEDGVHPNAEGYAVMEALLLPVLEGLPGQ